MKLEDDGSYEKDEELKRIFREQKEKDRKEEEVREKERERENRENEILENQRLTFEWLNDPETQNKNFSSHLQVFDVQYFQITSFQNGQTNEFKHEFVKDREEEGGTFK